MTPLLTKEGKNMINNMLFFLLLAEEEYPGRKRQGEVVDF
jgi:hypothetical protein